ncbi:hypothetical protein T4E_5914 [Trichinella pseudospiralis]|uniref:Uncharacterized protein n=1 Tax=Trichinella pseudospiralis TaxID=6337 RepID=A0A0V0YLJ4_TRIPS|nr:hypothetical protein T4E_5914 [Trichinella pseudospiralis]
MLKLAVIMPRIIISVREYGDDQSKFASVEFLKVWLTLNAGISIIPIAGFILNTSLKINSDSF